MLDIDEILVHIGKLGKYQIGMIALCCYASFVLGMPPVQDTFLGYDNQHRCVIPTCDLDNSTYEEDFLNYSVPVDNEGDYSKCLRYLALGNDSCTPQDFNSLVNETCNNWVYDTSVFQSSTVTDFDLVCDRTWLRPMSQSAYMVGMLIGGITIGDLSDRFGRKLGLSVSILLFFGGGLACTFVPDYTVYLLMRVFTGAGACSLFLIIFILAVEFVNKDLRTPVGVFVQIPFCLGETTVGLLAMGIRERMWLQLAIIAPASLLLPYIIFMPESIRWLVSKGHNEKAKKLIKRVAQINRIDLPSHLLEGQENMDTSADIDNSQPEDSKNFNESNNSKGNSLNEKKPHTKSILDILRRKTMRKRTLILFFAWFGFNLGNWGLDFNSGNLSGDIFVNFILIMLMELPGNAFMWLSLDRIGRKGSLSFTMILGGVCCLISGFIPEDLSSMVVGLNLIGKFGIASAFGISYIYSAELFPTEYRSVGIGACSTVGRIGGILAAPIAALASIYGPLPVMVFGIVATVSGATVLLLPETYGAELPQTLDQSDAFGRDQDVLYFTCCGSLKEVHVEDDGAQNRGFHND